MNDERDKLIRDEVVRDNVIHVSFTKDGAHRVLPKERVPSRARAAPEPKPASNADPLSDVYAREEVARLFEISEGRLRYWQRKRFILPSVKVGRQQFYSFQDLISIRAAKGLIERGVSTREVRRAVEALREALPRVIRPLSELRVVADGASVVVQDAAGAFEPLTGQLVLDFRVRSLREDVVRLLRSAPSEASRRGAYDLYLEGCRLDEDEATMERAAEAYRKALELDPTLANAVTNLGNIAYRKGDVDEAERAYRRALNIDANQPEAHYNLGYLRLEAGAQAQALEHFERALELDPGFADAHFNVALTLSELGRMKDAAAHWRTYLELEPTGAWADIARRHLELGR